MAPFLKFLQDDIRLVLQRLLDGVKKTFIRRHADRTGDIRHHRPLN